MSNEPRRLTARRAEPPQRLIDQGSIGSSRPASTLRFSAGSSAEPIVLFRASQRDLGRVLGLISDGARPSALVTGLGERPGVTGMARRECSEQSVAWSPDPLLFRTALPGYRTASYFKDLDYAPGRDEDPYTPVDFEDSNLLRHVGRNVVGRSFDLEANAVWSGSFAVSSPDDPWMQVNARLLRIGIDARDGWGDLPLLAPVILRMAGFMQLDEQLALIRSLRARAPQAFVVYIDGLNRESSAVRLASAIRLLLLLQEAGVDVILGRAGDLRRLALAFGVRGVEMGMGRLIRFALSDYTSSSGPGVLAPRLDFDSLLASLSAAEARPVLLSELVPEAECECPACAGVASVEGRVYTALEHDGHLLMEASRRVAGVAPTERVTVLAQAITQAEYGWRALHTAGLVSGRGGHLENWKRAIDLAAEWGLLDASEAADRFGLLD